MVNQKGLLVLPLVILILVVNASENSVNYNVTDGNSFGYSNKLDNKCSGKNITIEQQMLETQRSGGCHAYLCQNVTGEYRFHLVSCQEPKAEGNVTNCTTFNKDNNKYPFPVCCPRLKCIVNTSNGSMVRVFGQSGEVFPDQPLLTSPKANRSCQCNTITDFLDKKLAEFLMEAKRIVKRETLDYDDSSEHKPDEEGFDTELVPKFQMAREMGDTASSGQSLFDWLMWPTQTLLEHYYTMMRLQIKEVENLSYAYISNSEVLGPKERVV